MKQKEFSKKLLVWEGLLIWVITLSYIVLAFICIFNQFTGSLPWLSVIPGVAWTAYGTSQAFYYNKAKAENTKDGIKYETVLNELLNEENTDNSIEPFQPGEEEIIDTDYGI